MISSTNYLFVTIFFFANTALADVIPVDSIKVVIYGAEKTDLVTDSDLKRPGIDGSVRSKEDVVYERLMFQEAMRFNIIPDEDAIDAYLREIQREHDMTTEDLKRIFREAGYTYAQGRAEFGRIKSVNQVVNFRVISKLTIPKREIEEYYESHPEGVPGRYYLQHAVAHFPARPSDLDKEKIKKRLLELIKEDNSGDKIAWTDPYWLGQDEIAEDKQFIHVLEIDQVSEPYEIPDGFLVFKLLKKEEPRTLSLEDRYKEIEDILRQPKFVQRFEEYKQELKDSASFIYF